MRCGLEAARPLAPVDETRAPSPWYPQSTPNEGSRSNPWPLPVSYRGDRLAFPINELETCAEESL